MIFLTDKASRTITMHIKRGISVSVLSQLDITKIDHTQVARLEFGNSVLRTGSPVSALCGCAAKFSACLHLAFIQLHVFIRMILVISYYNFGRPSSQKREISHEM